MTNSKGRSHTRWLERVLAAASKRVKRWPKWKREAKRGNSDEY